MLGVQTLPDNSLYDISHFVKGSGIPRLAFVLHGPFTTGTEEIEHAQHQRDETTKEAKVLVRPVHAFVNHDARLPGIKRVRCSL